MERKHYIDNIRSFTVILVIIYHVFYIFNSAGVVSNMSVKGIQPLDAICYFVYPWMMCLMFLIAGISLRYSCDKRKNGEIIKTRLKKLIVPYFGGMFAFAWINGWVTSRYIDFFGGKNVPLIIRYLIYAQNIGPLWFLIELFLGTLLILLIHKLDKKDKIYNLCGKINIFGILLSAFLVWGSSFILNTPVMVVFRNGIYWLMMFLGYFVFSHDNVLHTLKKHSLPLSIAAILLGVFEVCFFWKENFTSDKCLMHPLTNLYLWVAILAILAVSQKYLNYTNGFLSFLKKRSFSYYLIHYPFMILIAYFLVTYSHLPMILIYALVFILSFVITFLISGIIRKIPVLRFVLVGENKKTLDKNPS